MGLKKNGFTLIETMITLVIAGIIAFALVSIIGQAFKIWYRAGEVAGIQSSSRGIVTKMTQELLEAVAVVGAPFTGASEINFSYDSNNDGQAELYRYYKSGEALLLAVGGGTPLTVGTGISNISFSASITTVSSQGYETSVISEVNIDLRAKEKGKDIDFRTRVVPRGGRR